MLTIEIDSEKRMAIHRASPGTVTLPDMLSAMGRLVGYANFKPEFTVVWNLKACDLDVTLQDIIHLDPHLVEQSNAARPAGKTAWVTSTAFGESIIKLLYGQHAWSKEWRTFSTLDAATTWCTSMR